MTIIAIHITQGSMMVMLAEALQDDWKIRIKQDMVVSPCSNITPFLIQMQLFKGRRGSVTAWNALSSPFFLMLI